MAGRDLSELEARIGHSFGSAALLAQALTHSSSTGGASPDNERLEFLGDAVVGLAVVEHLYRHFTQCSEGFLTQIKSHVVSAAILARRARALGLQDFALLGKGMPAGKSLSDAVLANLFESVVGAVYLDAGFERGREFVLDQLLGEIESSSELGPERNYKAALQQMATSRFGELPRYRVVSEAGPNHRKTFEVEAAVAGRGFGTARARTKRQAEQLAAAKALEALSAQDAESAGDAEDAEDATE